MFGIYCYYDTLKDNEVVYVGKDSHIDENRRYKQHLSHYCYNEQQINRVLQNNPDRFKYKVLKKGNFSQNLLNALEIIYIRRYSPRFNYTIGGEGSFGRVLSEETKEKLRQANLGKKHSLETRKKMSESRKGKNSPMYGKHLSDETKQKISDAHRGKKLSKPHREKLSKAKSGENNPMYGKHHSEESRRKISENHADVSGENNHWYGKTFSDEMCKNMSKSKNTSGYFRVYKRKEKGDKPDRWVYRYIDDNGKRKSISSIDIVKLEEKVKSKGLEWFKL